MRRHPWFCQILDPAPLGLFPQGRKCQLSFKNHKTNETLESDSSLDINNKQANSKISKEFN